eukprot:CAMPEP_0174338896 /NCGR_PEP_ID=MMETSP0810-20121108/23511_1 /TAXON_ID=73025 ORGANISM="Eutreptiella gymnastica-like, Strain CCMP1594" /NCGR_SAMPLE_ID=MMETSP0810 /ASSEMBLY_ACC=CAM_ASM_000659 /LENGTH=99 /DNA_ID=CAMNT_0015459273 /DNA_START=1686 /DNA_END=1982 /DNA_ORIENTATION=+
MFEPYTDSSPSPNILAADLCAPGRSNYPNNLAAVVVIVGGEYSAILHLMPQCPSAGSTVAKSLPLSAEEALRGPQLPRPCHQTPSGWPRERPRRRAPAT